MDLLRRMRGEGIAPTTPVFNAAIKACSKGGKLKLALALLDDMRAYGAPPVVDVAGPDSFRPRGKCGNSRPDDEAEAKTDLLREVQRGWRGGGGGVGTEDRSSAPDIQTFNTVMSACGRAGQWELALEMMRQAREQWGLRLTRVTYTTAIAACGRSRQAKRAVELLTEMREAGLVPDAISFNSAIAGYARTGRWKKALSLLREMESSQGAGGTEADGAATIRIPPDEFSYSSKIAACGKGGKWSLAVGIMDALVHLRKKRGAGGRGEATAGESALETPLWGMLYADDAGVISRLPGQLGKMMGVIVVVCAAIGLTVLEAKTEIMCLRAKGVPESTATFSVKAAGQVYNQTNEFVYLGGNVNHNADLSIEVDRRIRNAWCSFRKYILELYDRPSAPLELKLWMLRAEILETMLYGCVTWSPRACHYDTLRRDHHRFLTRCIGW